MAARLGAWVDGLPDGLDTYVGELGERMSGGERQRLAAARVLLADFPVMVLDEPGEHLDTATADAIVADVLDAAGDRAVLLITHRLAGLQAADEVIVLDGGRVLAARHTRRARGAPRCLCGHVASRAGAAMSWARRFRIRQYLRGSLWVLPLAGGVLGVLAGSGVLLLDKSLSLPDALTYSSSTASTLLTTIVGATAALTGFVVTVTVLVVQMATGTFSARYMRIWYRDRMLKAVLALLVGTLAFSFMLLRRVENNFVPNLGTSIAGVLLIVSLLVFLIFLDRFLHRLRPVAVASLVSEYVRRDFVARETRLAAEPDVFWGTVQDRDEPASVVARSARAGAIQAVDIEGLVTWAREHRRLVVMRHRIGDFVPAGAVLIEAYGGAAADGGEAEALRGMVALGDERTVEQDPSFAIRIMVDVAIKALSPAVNDPTTAVQVIDHLGDVLRVIGGIDLSRVAVDRGTRRRRSAWCSRSAAGRTT